jgi:hypothetical protein
MSKPRLTQADFERAATRLRCEVAAIKAVAEVESLGKGFYDDGFPVILFERHIFRRYTQGRYNQTHPHLSGQQGGYGAAGATQRRKFNEAFALNPDAAMKACSWGKFQIMGFNHAVCGFSTVGAFVDAMKISEGEHLDAFVSFVIENNLADELRRKNWAAFASGYNGAGYRKNRYDTKMATAYTKYSKTSAAAASAKEGPTNPASLDSDDNSSNITQKPLSDPADSPGDPPPPNPKDTQGPTSLVPMTTAVVEVETVTAAPTEPPKVEEESALTKIGNKANAAYTAFGTFISGAIAWFSGSPVGMVAAVMACVAILGVSYMLINALRANSKDKRDQAAKLELERIAAEERQKREDRAHQIQLKLMESASRPTQQTIRLVAPPTTELPNSTSSETAT